MDHRVPPAAVVVDEWPLVRLGVAQALRAADVGVAGEVGQAEEAVRVAGAAEARFVVLGNHRDLSPSEAARRAKALAHRPAVLVLIDRIGRNELAALLSVGIDALLPRSVSPAELADALVRVSKGERVVAPSLLSLLVGVLGPAGAVPDAGEAPGAGPGGPAEPLTRKELEVLARLAEGRTNREIADALFITPATVKSHLAHIYVKLGVTGRHEAMVRAVALGLLR